MKIQSFLQKLGICLALAAPTLAEAQLPPPSHEASGTAVTIIYYALGSTPAGVSTSGSPTNAVNCTAAYFNAAPNPRGQLNNGVPSSSTDVSLVGAYVYWPVSGGLSHPVSVAGTDSIGASCSLEQQLYAYASPSQVGSTSGTCSVTDATDGISCILPLTTHYEQSTSYCPIIAPVTQTKVINWSSANGWSPIQDSLGVTCYESTFTVASSDALSSSSNFANCALYDGTGGAATSTLTFQAPVLVTTSWY